MAEKNHSGEAPAVTNGTSLIHIPGSSSESCNHVTCFTELSCIPEADAEKVIMNKSAIIVFILFLG